MAVCLQDEDKGTLFQMSMDYIREWTPECVILENVQGLFYRHRETYDDIVKELEGLGYKVHDKDDPRYNTAEHGVPHHRPRIYIVAILRSKLVRPFVRPEPVPRPSIEKFLDKVSDSDKPGALPPRAAGKTKQDSRAHVAAAYKRARANGVDPKSECLVIDHRCSAKRRASFMADQSPCLTATRGAMGGYWLSTRGRPMRWTEAARLQGFTHPSAR